MSKYSSEIEGIKALNQAYHDIRNEISKVIVGQDEVIKFVLVSIFSNGHCLLMGVPGLAKTLLVQTVSRVLDLSFHRIQFTPDLMPSDIVGSEILGEDRTFKFIKGPVFANIILADEINRTPPKTQAALLEAMQEKSVTAAGITHQLPKPFFVLATQNPIEQEGTYPLPEAQLDRFMFNVHLTYPSFAEELAIVKNTTGTQVQELNKIITAADISAFQQLVRNIPVADNVLEYAVKLVAKTRPQTDLSAEIVNRYISWGAGPRASQYLVIGAKCHAAIQGKFSPDIEDVQAVATTILRHRLVKNYKAEADGISIEHIIKQVL
ncbi:ATPase associated with various cellular activities AAA_3 [Pseudopedobacter saltans DSM 12145]|uniref:ATPase associated with various cellular activities AAA_3 n=1 Tax=Pseudopedobacter saltans (strain ATCC 51119 / DSM 12145 / JCM 21818 / CCUG 39354 / LMG 10337 / NBRC 100064 / NCIMB 13643) TaxID=762903 RepID=F0SDJ3_PSESL|nr:AAA family ATPase [Pseudopedobacter saltans]ADY53976.1 ATPase associated with various cellular activities AAA_3 [Pseudopedobacter saltans DSM 12145]